MLFDVEINGRACQVSVDREEGRYRVTVGGRTHLVDSARVDERTVSLILLGENARSYEAGVLETAEPGELEVYLRAGVVRCRVNGGRSRAPRAGGRHEAGATGVQRVTAPMPGKVLRVLVAPGDQVRARQGLVVVEAMKMENELRSPKDGRVKEVHAAEGTSVEAGRLLVVIE